MGMPWQANILALRNLIDTNCQVMYSGNWASQAKKDWRWLKNLQVSKLDICRYAIEDAQRDFGVLNVTIGQPFDTKLMKPYPQMMSLGLYVRDAQDLVKALTDALDDDSQLERWING